MASPAVTASSLPDLMLFPDSNKSLPAPDQIRADLAIASRNVDVLASAKAQGTIAPNPAVASAITIQDQLGKIGLLIKCSGLSDSEKAGFMAQRDALLTKLNEVHVTGFTPGSIQYGAGLGRPTEQACTQQAAPPNSMRVDPNGSSNLLYAGARASPPPSAPLFGTPRSYLSMVPNSTTGPLTGQIDTALSDVQHSLDTGSWVTAQSQLEQVAALLRQATPTSDPKLGSQMHEFLELKSQLAAKTPSL